MCKDFFKVYLCLKCKTCWEFYDISDLNHVQYDYDFPTLKLKRQTCPKCLGLFLIRRDKKLKYPNNLYKYMKQLNITQRKLATLTSLSQGFISNIKRGKKIEKKFVNKIVKALKVSNKLLQIKTN